jgi:hypothetical protein
LDADIELLPSDAGGKRRSIRSGYRPLLWFGETGPAGEPDLHSALLRLRRRGSLAPGDKGSVVVTPLAWETWPHVTRGTEFDIFDGGHYVGRGVLTSSPQESLSELEVRRALNRALEEWVVERFPNRVTRTSRVAGRRQPDLLARFKDENEVGHLLVAEVVGRRPTALDVDQLVELMADLDASLGLLVGVDEPTPETWNAVYRQGRLELPGGLWIPRLRVLTTRDLAREDVDLLPERRAPDELELLAG